MASTGRIEEVGVDPVTLVAAALAAGASAGMTDAASETIKSAYGYLRTLVMRAFAADQLARSALDGYEKDPEVWEKPLKAELAKVDVDRNEEILSAARSLLSHADPAGTAAGKYTVTVTGSQGVVIGDFSKVDMRFGDDT
jgi:hypothetical protein